MLSVKNTYRFFILLVLLGPGIRTEAQLGLAVHSPDSLRMIELYERAQLMYKNGQYNDAFRSANEALDLSISLNDERLELGLQEMIGDIHVKEERAANALPSYLRVSGAYAQKEDSLALLRVYTKIAQAYRVEAVHTKELEYYQKIYELLPESRSEKRLEIRSRMGTAAYHAGNYERAVRIFADLLPNYEEGGLNWQHLELDLVKSYDAWGKYDSALYHSFELQEVYEEPGREDALLPLQNNIGYYQTLSGDYEDAASNYLHALHLAEGLKVSAEEKALILSNIAVCYANMGRRSLAVDYFNVAIEELEEAGAWEEKSRNENMLANLYHKTDDLYNAKQFCQKAINSAQKAPDAWREAEAYLTYSRVLRDGNEPMNALSYYEKYLYIRDSIEFAQRFKLEMMETRKAQLEKEERELQLRLKEEEVKDLAIEQLTLRNERIEQERAILMQQRDLDMLKQDSLEQSMTIMDQKHLVDKQKQENMMLEQEKMLQEKENLEQAMALEAEQRENILLENQQRVTELENERLESAKRANFWAMIGVGLIALLVAGNLVLARRKNQLLKKQKAEIEDKNSDLEMKNEEISAQRDEIEAQRDIVFEQKQAIEAYNEDVMKSIAYAERLQAAALPSLALLAQHVEDHFVLFRPRDVVSGDFYWFAHVEDKTVVTVADCTGHGVPGAFMSMMGMSLLKEVVEKEYITHPGVILRRLRKEIMENMGQKGESGEQRDGMDMALVTIDRKEGILSYSGAYNPLYLIRKTEHAAPLLEGLALEPKMNNGCSALYEIPADKMPIAHFERMDKFRNHEIKIEEGDSIYMFSDGYADQFGGEKGKKFMSRRFKELLMKHCGARMKEQNEILAKTLDEWMGDVEQVDDICVLGMALS